MINHIINH